jgi:membrane fusion protein, multidrug efflux system
VASLPDGAYIHQSRGIASNLNIRVDPVPLRTGLPTRTSHPMNEIKPNPNLSDSRSGLNGTRPTSIFARPVFWVVVVVVVLTVALVFIWKRNHADVSPPAGASGASGAPGASGASGAAAPGAAGKPPGAGGRGGAAAAANRPQPVGVATVTKGKLSVFLSSLGTITPLATVTVHARVDGQLVKLWYKEGQLVKAGDALVTIDPNPYQAALVQAQGALKRDQALLENSRIDLERYKTLFAQDSIAEQQLATQAALVKQYEGTVLADKGNVDAAQVQLNYTHITSPVSGRVGLRQVDIGNIVHAADTNGVVVVTQLQPIDVVYSIPEDSLPTLIKAMHAGDKVLVEAYDRDQKVRLAQGAVLTIDNMIDPTTGTVKVKAEFDNPDNALFANQFVVVRTLVSVRPNATLVSTAAVMRGSQGLYVYQVKPDQTVTVRNVKLGPTQGELSSVDEGINPGDVVVVDGMDKLREGAKVDAIDRAAQAATPAAGQHGGRRAAGQGAAPDANAPATGQTNAGSSPHQDSGSSAAPPASQANGNAAAPPAAGDAAGAAKTHHHHQQDSQTGTSQPTSAPAANP